MEKDKELIDEIVDRLKNQKEVKYREGAWEKFQASQAPASSKSKIVSFNRWISVAAACLLLGLGVMFYINRLKNDVITDATLPNLANNDLESRSRTQESETKISQNNKQEESTRKDANLTNPVLANIESNKNNRITLEQIDINESIDYDYSIDKNIALEELDFNKEFQIANLEVIDSKQPKLKAISNLENITLAASATTNNSVIAFKEVEAKNQQRHFNLSEKFDLGLFVSPHSTAEKMYVGGGLSIAYNLNKKLSLRTGASYNNYEVGIMKNPTEMESVEAVMTTSSSKELGNNVYSGAGMQQVKMMLPNINAIRGSVQSIDVPLELKYNVNNTLYAAAGISYSAIINQERNAQYIENVNTETFRNGFPEDASQASKVVQPVTKTVKSAEKNVNTNGYNGFINFSIGKKLNLNKKVGLSVEPYFKVPVGEYRRADMNYTNGGIRIMTNF